MIKNKIITSLFVLLFAVLFISYEIISNNPKTYKILKVIEADKFYVDFNKDNQIDSDELVKLQDILAFSSVKSGFTVLQSQNLGLDINDYLKNGYLAKSFAIDNLEGKYILVKDIKVEYTKYNKYTFIKADYNGEDLAGILLKYGLAYPYKSNNFDYYQQFNLNASKNNISFIKDIEFYLLNKNNNIIHKLSCEFADKLHFGELIPSKIISKYNVRRCKSCFKIVDKILSSGEILKSKNTYKKSVYKKFADVELFLINPVEYKLPSDKCRTDVCKTIVREINSANKSIDIALYGFSSQNEILYALENAKNRGVNIRIVMDYSKNSENIYKDSILLKEKFSAVTDKTEILMHNKFFIFDNKKVLTGSMNISSSGSGGYNANVMVLVNSEELAKYYEAEFSQMYSGKFQQNKKKINTSPVIVGDATITPYFSPKSDIYKNAILPLILSAKNEIFISIFYLTDRRLVSELINAKKRGVSVVVLWDSLGAINFKNLFNELRKENIIVKAENWGGKNHEKTILADNKLLIGSANFSSSGFNKNDENILVIENNEIAKLYRDYFSYLFNTVDNKYLNYIPRAEGTESGNSCHDGIDNNFDGFKDLEDDGCKIKK